MSKRYSGLNIRWPWSELLLSGEKIVETRSYPLPAKYLGKPLAIIETFGKDQKRRKDVGGARVIGLITFEESFRYTSKSQWLGDFHRHRVPPDDPNFRYRPPQEKWGWVVRKVESITPPKKAPKRRGIVFATNCWI